MIVRGDGDIAERQESAQVELVDLGLRVDGDARLEVDVQPCRGGRIPAERAEADLVIDAVLDVDRGVGVDGGLKQATAAEGKAGLLDVQQGEAAEVDLGRGVVAALIHLVGRVRRLADEPHVQRVLRRDLAPMVDGKEEAARDAVCDVRQVQFAADVEEEGVGVGGLAECQHVDAERRLRVVSDDGQRLLPRRQQVDGAAAQREDRKSTRLNSSHVAISYAVFCLKKKIQTRYTERTYNYRTVEP